MASSVVPNTVARSVVRIAIEKIELGEKVYLRGLNIGMEPSAFHREKSFVA